jgi:peptidoglycan/LPS O-acetylase OafA/YrhL
MLPAVAGMTAACYHTLGFFGGGEWREIVSCGLFAWASLELSSSQSHPSKSQGLQGQVNIPILTQHFWRSSFLCHLYCLFLLILILYSPRISLKMRGIGSNSPCSSWLSITAKGHWKSQTHCYCSPGPHHFTSLNTAFFIYKLGY